MNLNNTKKVKLYNNTNENRIQLGSFFFVYKYIFKIIIIKISFAAIYHTGQHFVA